MIAILQARLGSSRLASKILSPLAGQPLLELLVSRLLCARVDEWWLATSSAASDDVTEAWGHSLGLRVYRGDETDVLSRFVAIVRERKPQWVVRVCADDPFSNAEVVDWLLDARNSAAQESSLLQLGPVRSVPLGYAPQLVRASALLRAEKEIPPDQPHHRAHVATWFAAQNEVAWTPPPADWPARPGWRWTIDTFDDLAMARSAFGLFGARARDISYADMVDRLDRHPEIMRMNANVVQRSWAQG